MEHIRELRTRVVRALVALTLGVIIAWAVFQPIFDWLVAPYDQVEPLLNEAGVETQKVIRGVGGGFQVQLKVALSAGLVISSPLWLWQMWAFVLPALHRHEKRIVLVLTAVCVPLFVLGAWVGYLIMPNAIELLIGFVPSGWLSQLTAAEYLSFLLRIMLVFGLAAQLPVIVIGLHRLGLVSTRQLAHARPWIIVSIFIFAAVATPTPDPINMLILAIPMTVLYGLSEIVVRLTDRRRLKA